MVAWFKLQVINMGRAKKFYETFFKLKMIPLASYLRYGESCTERSRGILLWLASGIVALKNFFTTIEIHNLDGLTMGWFPSIPTKPGTVDPLVKHGMDTPSDTEGVVIYF